MRSVAIIAAAVGVASSCGCAAKPGKGKGGPMKLEICGERTIVDPSDEDIRSALGGLDAEAGDAFVILSPPR